MRCAGEGWAYSCVRRTGMHILVLRVVPGHCGRPAHLPLWRPETDQRQRCAAGDIFARPSDLKHRRSFLYPPIVIKGTSSTHTCCSWCSHSRYEDAARGSRHGIERCGILLSVAGPA